MVIIWWCYSIEYYNLSIENVINQINFDKHTSSHLFNNIIIAFNSCKSFIRDKYFQAFRKF